MQEQVAQLELELAQRHDRELDEERDAGKEEDEAAVEVVEEVTIPL